MKLAKILAASVAATAITIAVTAPTPVFAQQTDGSIRGIVTDGTGAPISGATVTIEHEPSGTTDSATTGANGGFFQSGLRVGGPYTITIEAPGRAQAQKRGVFLDAGETEYLTFNLEALGAVADEVTVIGRRPEQLDLNSGAGSSFDNDDISNQPSFGRDLTSTLLRDPLLNSTTPGVLSIGGLNPRLNGLAIDGVLQQDDFGLSNSTYPTLRSPISLDTVQAASVVASDYSVKASGFQGGLINVVTKSGTNDLNGSLYYYRSSDTFRGEKPNNVFVDAGDFKNREYGVTVGGPILKDRLFFFGAYEKFKNTQSRTNDFAGNLVDPALFTQIRQITQTVYGFDPGEISANFQAPQESVRWLGKIDWNVTDDHRASFTYQRTNDTDIAGTGVFVFPSAWYNSGKIQNAYSGQLFSDWSENFSTTLRVAYKDNETIQDSRANAIDPTLGEIVLRLNQSDTPFLLTGASTRDIILGADRFRHANFFDDSRFQVYFAGDYSIGDHVITFGAEFEEYELFNVFVPQSRGQFRFDSITAYQSRIADLVSYGNVRSNNAVGSPAEWGYQKWAAFFQDEWQVTPSFIFSAGVRADMYSMSDAPTLRTDVTNRTGVNNTATLDGIKTFQPRFGFRWEPFDRTKVSGGFGLFTGGDPKVWISNAFNEANFQASQALVPNVDGRSGTIPASLLTAVANATALAPSDLIDPDFQAPAQWKGSVRIDQDFDLDFIGLGQDYRLSLQFLYTKEKYGYAWVNLGQLVQPIGRAPDGRPIYVDQNALGQQHDIMLTNSSEGRGRTFSVQLAKEYDFGLDFNISYTNSDVTDVQTGSSSRGVSSWRGAYDFDRNNLSVGPSIYQTKHKFALNLGYETSFYKDLVTRFDLFGLAFSGNPFSYTFDVGNTNALFGRAGNPENPFDNDLVYIPALSGGAFSDPRVVFGCAAGPASCATQAFDQARFLNFIKDRGIATGGIVGKNSDQGPWNQIWNFRFQQDLPFADFGLKALEGNRFKFVVDIDNIANLLNSKWGTFRFTAPSNNGQPIVTADLVSAAAVAALGPNPTPAQIAGLPALTGNAPNTTCLTEASCVYRFNSFRDNISTGNINNAQSVWSVRFGLRYEF
jgi:hypothetical protein